MLCFSQDDGFNVTAFQHLFLPSVPWYQERYMKQVSLGSLMLLCVLRTLVFNLAKLNDLYLLDTFLAVISNMSPHMESIHPYASQRLVAVTLTVLKKYSSCAHRLAAAREASGVRAGDSSVLTSESLHSSESPVDLEQMLDVYKRSVEVLVRTICTCLRPRQIHKNTNIAYAIMHKQHSILEALADPAFLASQGVAEGGGAGSMPPLSGALAGDLAFLRSLIQHIDQRIDQAAEQDLSVERIMEIIERSTSTFPGIATSGGTAQTITRDDHLPVKIAHQEPDEPESFFVQYAWDVIKAFSQGDLHWRQQPSAGV
uniref:Dymeclin n=1 Tax=Rhizochromulina marina TaxID=1034831 RepID=A0A7S2WV06_9STRA